MSAGQDGGRRSLMWFRRDLRTRDNIALTEACRAADRGVVALYVLTPAQWREHDEAAAKVAFWLRNLRSLSRDLEEMNISLRVEQGDRFGGVAEIVERVARKFEATDLYFHHEYEVNEKRRDEAIAKRLRESGLKVHAYDDRVVVPPGEILTTEGKTYTVFTPFKKSWLDRVQEEGFTVERKPRQLDERVGEPSEIPDAIDGFDLSCDRADLWPEGEDFAGNRLESFVRGRGEDYDAQRDLPGVNGTSLLSPYLAAGVLSPRQCLAAAQRANSDRLRGGKKSWDTWISELVWREFYTHILDAFPRVSKGRAFLEKTESIAWRDDDDAFEAWKDGRTGYPIVDAAMRQLEQTAWMHNRLRMIAAMFLTKHLLIDWRRGEAHFMRRLVDGDLASNNGGWQWSASTGTDAAPYFRIFNPYSQSRRYDSEGKFIRKFCPELESVEGDAIHEPSKLDDGEREQLDYPAPIVEHRSARERALEVFKDAMQ